MRAETQTNTRSRHGLRLGLAGLVACALCAVLPAAAGAASYVAMGDSYTSGPGIEPYAPSAPPECGQSELSYPYLVASALKLSITDVSCGGAKTENFTVAQYPAQPPQFEALSESTEVVSLGMGGNDGNLFETVLTKCTEDDIYNGKMEKAPCKTEQEGFVNTTLAADKAPAEKALEEIKTKSPHAKVFVVGYPDIAPKNDVVDEKAVCGADFPWLPGDLKWFLKVEKTGNKDLKADAKAKGAIFVETFKQSVGHDACEEVGTRWIEPVFGSLTGVAVHPNATGEQEDAFDVELTMLKAGVR